MTAVIVTGMVSVLVAVLALAGGPRVQPLLEAPVGGVASGRGRPAGPLPRGRDSGGAVPVTPQPLDVGSVAVRLLALGGCTGAGWALLGGPLGLGVGGAAGIAAWIGLSHLEPPSARHRRVHMQARYPLVLDLLAGVVEAGAPMRQAVRQVADVVGAPDRDPLDRVLTACGVGSTDAEAWLGLLGDPLW
ncbi:MAG: hypothetical protein FWC46_07625, partial [Actinomycetia bacterium]|nr:hypothetical protein [Actinomycetes bacterium]